MEDIVNISNHYKKVAESLIRDKDILNSLSKFGEVIPTGSFKYNLMLNADIDLYVVRDKPFVFDEVLQIFNKIVLENKFRSYFIKGNWDDIRIGKKFPNGHYIGIKEKVKGETWKFDIWFIDKKELYRLQKYEPKNIDEKQRKTILKIKQLRNKKGLNIPGLEIYQNVVLDKWKSLKDFNESLKK